MSSITRLAPILILEELTTLFSTSDLLTKRLETRTPLFKIRPPSFDFSAEIQELRRAIALLDSLADQSRSIDGIRPSFIIARPFAPAASSSCVAL
jgi:hypothetical protein